MRILTQMDGRPRCAIFRRPNPKCPQSTSTGERGVLYDLSASARLLLNHGQLLQRVWSKGLDGSTGTVRTIVNPQRRKLGDDAYGPAYIITNRRVGYWMEKGEEED